MADTPQNWSETSSSLYHRLSRIVVPRRTEQIATLLTLIPFRHTDTFQVVELASGEGLLAQAILAAFPHAKLLALDGSDYMREQTIQATQAYSDRVRVDSFDMLQTNWYGHLDGANCVVSSLCIHHLDDSDKAALYREIASRMASPGALLIADIIAPSAPPAEALFAATWDAAVESAAQSEADAEALVRLYYEENWNIYRHPDAVDKPSRLFDQLKWLAEAGFNPADCFWMHAAHAIYGGYKTADGQALSPGIPYTDALRIADDILT